MAHEIFEQGRRSLGGASKVGVVRYRIGHLGQSEKIVSRHIARRSRRQTRQFAADFEVRRRKARGCNSRAAGDKPPIQTELCASARMMWQAAATVAAIKAVSMMI